MKPVIFILSAFFLPTCPLTVSAGACNGTSMEDAVSLDGQELIQAYLMAGKDV